MKLRSVLSFATLLCLFMMSSSLYAQSNSYSISGFVYDQNSEPIAGATIIEKGTTTGAISIGDGSFSLRVSSAEALLEVSFMGYVSTEVIADEVSTDKPIILEDDVQKIDEVVVIGYGTVKKNDMTGSVVAIKAEDMNRGAVTSPQQLMQGKVAGLHVLPGDGGPGSSSTIRIRGAASLNASNDPLIVIDGVPVSNSSVSGMSNMLSSINPDDIESFTVLKDASATAIYGSRASNGVIMVTTKKGRSNVLNISYSSSYSLSQNTKNIDVLSADEYRKFMYDFYPESTTNGQTIRNLMGSASTSWQDEIFRTAFSTSQNLSLYGKAGSWLPYRASLGYTTEDGTLKTSNFERTTFNLNLNPTLLDNHLTINLNANGFLNNNNFASSGAVSAAAFFNPTSDIYFRDENGNIDKSVSNGWWNWYNNGTPNSLANENPLSMLYDNYNTSKANRFTGNAQIDYKMHFLPELRANLNLGYDRSWADSYSGTREGSFNADKDTDVPSLGKYSITESLSSNELLEFYLSYNKEIGRNRFDLLGGYSWQHFYSESDSRSYINGNNDLFYDYDPFKTEYYLLSFFGRANYSIDGKYLFTATLRNDASSRFHESVRWGLFPSAAFAWNVKQENWLKHSRVLEDLRFRASWGITGQQDISQGDYPYLPRYTIYTNPGVSYPIDGTFTHVLQPLGYNEMVKWETTETINLGVDYSLFGGRISGSLDAYHRHTRDLLNVVPVAMGANFSNAIISNIGNMKNRGLEFSIDATPIRRGDFRWDIGLNATWQDTKITKLTATADQNYGVGTGYINSGTGSTIQIHKEGHSPYTFYTYKQVYDDKGMPVQNTFVDLNGDGVITEADRYLTDKSPNPDYYFGINSTFRYKNWDFGFNGRASVGNWVYNDFYASNSTVVGDYITQGFLSNIAKTAFKSGFTEKNSNQQVYSDMFLENASFFRMDDITLGRTFNNIGSTKLRLRTSFSLQNAFVISKYSGLDPENSGIDYNMWPRPRVYTLRMNFDF